MAGAWAIDGRVPCLAIAVVLPSAAALTAATARGTEVLPAADVRRGR
jgi:hypothetical protein